MTRQPKVLFLSEDPLLLMVTNVKLPCSRHSKDGNKRNVGLKAFVFNLQLCNGPKCAKLIK